MRLKTHEVMKQEREDSILGQFRSKLHSSDGFETTFILLMYALNIHELQQSIK